MTYLPSQASAAAVVYEFDFLAIDEADLTASTPPGLTLLDTAACIDTADITGGVMTLVHNATGSSQNQASPWIYPEVQATVTREQDESLVGVFCFRQNAAGGGAYPEVGVGVARDLDAHGNAVNYAAIRTKSNTLVHMRDGAFNGNLGSPTLSEKQTRIWIRVFVGSTGGMVWEHSFQNVSDPDDVTWQQASDALRWDKTGWAVDAAKNLPGSNVRFSFFISEYGTGGALSGSLLYGKVTGFTQTAAITENIYEGDGNAVTVGTVSGEMRSLNGCLTNCAVFDPDSLVSITTTSGKILPAVSGPATNGHYSYFSSNNAFTATPAIIFPGLIGDGCYFEVEELENTTRPAYTFSRITIGAFARESTDVFGYGRWAGLEWAPQDPANDAWGVGARVTTTLYTHTALATGAVAGNLTIRIELTNTPGTFNALDMVVKINGTAVATITNCPIDANSNWAIGLAGSVLGDTYRVGTIRTGTLR